MSTTATPTATAQTAATYASFGARFLAFLIDSIIIWCLQAIVIAPIMTFMGLGIAAQVSSSDGEVSEEQVFGMLGTIFAAAGTAMIIVSVLTLLYFAIMESSKSQASLGKMALGIKVTDMEGNRLTFGKALLRSIGKIISSMILYIGYLIAAFTEKRQALHDLIASTLVVKK